MAADSTGVNPTLNERVGVDCADGLLLIPPTVCCGDVDFDPLGVWLGV